MATVTKRSGMQKLHCRLDGYVCKANKGRLKGCIHHLARGYQWRFW